MDRVSPHLQSENRSKTVSRATTPLNGSSSQRYTDAQSFSSVFNKTEKGTVVLKQNHDLQRLRLK